LYSMYYFAHLLFNLLIIPHKKTTNVGLY
jgi:hypothetical protein